MPVSKGPLNYTTTIAPSKTAGECVDLLVKHGATHVTQMFENRQPTGLAFVVVTKWGPRQFVIMVNTGGIHEVLKQAWRDSKIPGSRATREQAERTGWRVTKDWLESQLALIAAGAAEMEQIMLPWMSEDGRTLYEIIDDNQMRALES